MDKELSYVIRGVILALLFFIVIKLINYSISYTYLSSQENIVINSYPEEKELPQFAKGKGLFSQNCASCHARNKILTGPALLEVQQRIPDKKLLYDWIRNSDKVLKSGNSYFNNLFKTYKVPMTHFPSLTDEDIQAILEYIDREEMARPQSSVSQKV